MGDRGEGPGQSLWVVRVWAQGWSLSPVPIAICVWVDPQLHSRLSFHRCWRMPSDFFSFLQLALLVLLLFLLLSRSWSRWHA